MTADVVIVGAGIIGCATARALAREGRSVLVVDREDPGRHASWAAAGMLAPQAEADRQDDFLDLLLLARSRFPDLAAELKDETGLDVGYRAEGMMVTAFDDEDEAELRERHEWQRAAGLDVEALTPEEARGLEPILSQELRGALLFPGDHQVDNRILVRALWFSAHAAGARFASGTGVRGLEQHGAGVRLQMEDGDTVDAPIAVLAAGSWSGRIAGLPRTIPVEPVHGQLIALDTTPPVLRHNVASARGYIVPRADGRLIVGATMERVGFHTAVTPVGMSAMTQVAIQISDELRDRRILAHWSGLRPGTPDGLPILGPDPDLPHLIYATGHFRNGILLAPVTAEIVGDLVASRPPRVDLAPYRADRFA